MGSSPRVSGRAPARRRLILCTTLRVIHVCGQRRRARSLLQSTRSRPGEFRRCRTPSQWGSKQREAATGSATRPQAGGLAERARTDGALCCGQARRPPARVPSTSPAEGARRKSASSFGRRGGLGNCMSRQKTKERKRRPGGPRLPELDEGPAEGRGEPRTIERPRMRARLVDRDGDAARFPPINHCRFPQAKGQDGILRILDRH